MTAFLGVAGGIAAPEFQPSSDRRHDLDPPMEHWLSRPANWFSSAERNLPTSGRLNGRFFARYAEIGKNSWSGEATLPEYGIVWSIGALEVGARRSGR